MITRSQVINSNNSLTILNLSRIIFTTNTNSNITSSILRNSDCNSYRLALFSFTNLNTDWSIIFRSSYFSCSVGCFMSIITGVNYFNFMSTRSYITIQLNNSSAVNNFGSISLITNFNSHITSSIITNNNHNSTITIINYFHVRNFFSLLNSQITDCGIRDVIIITIINNSNSMITSRQVINSNNSLTILNLSRIILTTNTNSNITSSILRNSNCNSDRLTLFSLTNLNTNRCIIFRSGYVCEC